jgi:hypothetical protein
MNREMHPGESAVTREDVDTSSRGRRPKNILAFSNIPEKMQAGNSLIQEPTISGWG